MAFAAYPDNSASPGGGAGRGRATVAMGFVTGMLAGLGRLGRDPGPVLAAAGIPPESLVDPAARRFLL